MRRSRRLFAEVEHGLGVELRDKPLLTVFDKHNDPFRFQARFRAIKPQLAQVVFSGPNHFPMCAHPDEFSSAIANWYATEVA